MSDHSEAERGRLAQSVLDNTVYAESYALIEESLTRVWRDSRDAKEREEVHQLLRMLDKTKALIESVMRTGKLAEAEIKRKQSLAERAMGTLRRVG